MALPDGTPKANDKVSHTLYFEETSNALFSLPRATKPGRAPPSVTARRANNRTPDTITQLIPANHRAWELDSSYERSSSSSLHDKSLSLASDFGNRDCAAM